jgi:hypothetical protein
VRPGSAWLGSAGLRSGSPRRTQRTPSWPAGGNLLRECLARFR